jgi:hypothetical protein
MCSFLKKCIACTLISEFLSKCCACFKKGMNCSAIGKFLTSTCGCNWEKLDCCDARKGCSNPLNCCKECPCFSSCKQFDTCVCCEKSVSSTKGFCSDLWGRCCNCCYSFKKSVGTTGSNLKNNLGRGKYAPKGKLYYNLIFF